MFSWFKKVTVNDDNIEELMKSRYEYYNTLFEYTINLLKTSSDWKYKENSIDSESIYLNINGNKIEIRRYEELGLKDNLCLYLDNKAIEVIGRGYRIDKNLDKELEKLSYSRIAEERKLYENVKSSQISLAISKKVYKKYTAEARKVRSVVKSLKKHFKTKQ